MPQYRNLEDALRDVRRHAARLGDRAGDLAHELSDEVGARLRDVRRQLPNVRLPDVHLPEVRLSDLRLPALRRRPPPPPPPAAGAAAVAVPLLLVAAGAGLGWAAWRLWSQSQARARLDAEGGAAGAADPAGIMAHNPPPAGGPVETADPSAAGLTAPAEQVMAHSPPPNGASEAGAKPAAPRGKAVAGPKPGELLSSTAGAGLGGGAEPHLSAKPTPSLGDAIKPQGPRTSKPPELKH